MPPKKGKVPSDVDVSTRSAAIQLKECLRLENNPELFDGIRNNLRKLTKEHLDINGVAYRQKDAMTRIQAELQDQYPDIFDSEDKERRLYLAVRVIRQQHSWQKRKRRIALVEKDLHKSSKVVGQEGNSNELLQKNLGDENTPKRGYPSTPSGSCEQGLEEISVRSFSRSMEPLTPSLALNRRTENVASTQSSSTNRISTSTLLDSPFQPSSQSSDMSGPSTLTQLATDQSITNLRSSHSNTRSISQCSKSHTPRPLGTGIPAVLKFLDCCTPSMRNHLHRFINFGCSSEEYLLAVSGWKPEVIGNFLKQVFTDRQTGQVSVNAMDIFVLQNHFSTYYWE